MKVSELTGEKLAHWVARAQRWEWHTAEEGNPLDLGEYFVDSKEQQAHKDYRPDINWSQCGELIEKFEMVINTEINEVWRMEDTFSFDEGDPKPAICRAVVASVYGEEVSDED